LAKSAVSEVKNVNISTRRLQWLDVVRGVAILWIFLVHFVERIVGGPFFANPRAGWPPLMERFTQLLPLGIDGFSGVLANLLRWIGWLGDQGVQVFVIASGFGLAYSAIEKIDTHGLETPAEFYRKRFLGIIPQWWLAHLGWMIPTLLIGIGLPIVSTRTVASLFGFRFLPDVMYYFSPAWWYIGVLIQLYLLFPFLIRYLRKVGPYRFFAIIGGGAIIVRTVGLIVFDTYAPSYLDWWSRGAIFVSRLPEFSFGIAIAVLYRDSREVVDRWTRSSNAVAAWIVVYLVGNAASFFLVGMGIAFLLTGSAIVAVTYAAVSKISTRRIAPIRWFGRNSYSFFLVHHPTLIYLVPVSLSLAQIGPVVGYLAISLAVSTVLAIILRFVADQSIRLIRKGIVRFGERILVLAAAIAVFALLFGIYLTEFMAVKFAPQEVYGWGERPALQPHP
jgi:peptidoglycan/LPS O-acetylase OafA/YrhL